APAVSQMPDGGSFDSASAAANRVANDSGNIGEVQKFLNQNRRAVSEGERLGTSSKTSEAVNDFLHEAQAKGATYGGPVYRGTTEAELAQIAKTGRATHTLSVSQDIEGAGH